jgi:hypothetical protein
MIRTDESYAKIIAWGASYLAASPGITFGCSKIIVQSLDSKQEEDYAEIYSS